MLILEYVCSDCIQPFLSKHDERLSLGLSVNDVSLKPNFKTSFGLNS